jgi:hypothetical protein
MMLRLLAATAIAALIVLAGLAPAALAENPAGQPPFGAEPEPELQLVDPAGEAPAGFRLEPGEAIALADAAGNVVAEREESPQMQPRLFTRGSERWQVSYFDPADTEVAQAIVDDRSGAVVEAWRDHQVEVKLARGYEGAVAGVVNAPWIWLPLCLAFFLPFFDPRRPLRLLHLDLLVLLAFGISSFFFNRGEITLSVPLVYPILGYLLVRMTLAGLRPRQRAGPLVPLVPIRWLAYAAIALAVGRIALNIADSQVIDIGFAGVAGADRIASGEGVYDGGFTPLIDRGDSYGPLNYLIYIPFEAALPWSGGLEPLPAAHALAIVFDLLAVGGLLLLGRRLRDGAEGAALGVALAYAWLAYPYTLYALNVNGNDAVVAALLVAALLVISSPAARGAVIAAAAAVKFGPLGLVPLFAAGRGERDPRTLVLFGLPFLAVWAVVLIPLLPDGGLSEFYDRTFGYQASRGSPFSVWGLAPSLEPLQPLVRALPVLAGIAAFFLPRRRSTAAVAALGAALLILTQLGSMHWFYFFILWFAPYVFVALFAESERVSGRSASAAGRAAAS